MVKRNNKQCWTELRFFSNLSFQHRECTFLFCNRLLVSHAIPSKLQTLHPNIGQHRRCRFVARPILIISSNYCHEDSQMFVTLISFALHALVKDSRYSGFIVVYRLPNRKNFLSEIRYIKYHRNKHVTALYGNTFFLPLCWKIFSCKNRNWN